MAEKTLTLEQQIGGVEASPDSYTVLARLKDIVAALGGSTVERQESSQNLATAALDFTTSISEKCKLKQVFLHASQNITELVEVFWVSVTGATYTTKLISANLVGEADLVWIPDGDFQLADGDEIQITCTQTGGAGTVYVTIIALS